MTAPAESDESPVRYRYTGDGTNYVEGVPARDLTREEWNALTAEQQKAVRSSGLYERAAGRRDEPDEAAEPATEPTEPTEPEKE